MTKINRNLLYQVYFCVMPADRPRTHVIFLFRWLENQDNLDHLDWEEYSTETVTGRELIILAIALKLALAHGLAVGDTTVKDIAELEFWLNPEDWSFIVKLRCMYGTYERRTNAVKDHALKQQSKELLNKLIECYGDLLTSSNPPE